MQRSNLIIESNSKSPTKKESRSIFSKTTLFGGDLTSPSSNGTIESKQPLMTRRQLNDPFGSDDEDEKDMNDRKSSPPKELMSPPIPVDDVSYSLNKFYNLY
jgi:hypothetical protein